MICKRCFRMSDDGLNYCPYCGKSFTDDSEIDIGEKKETDENSEEKNERFANEPPKNDFIKREPINMFASPAKPVEKSHAAKVFSSISHAILYVLLFLVLQTVVASIFSAVVMMNASTEYMNEFYLNSGIDYSSLSDEEYEALINRLTGELNVIMMDAVNDVDVNAVSVVSTVSTGLALFIIAKIRKRKFSDHVGIKFSALKKWHAWLVIPAGIAAQYLTILIVNIIPFSEETLKSYEELYSYMGSSPLWLEILAVAVAAPMVEELIFRGCAYSRLRRSMSPFVSALISSFFFGIAHGHIIAVVYAFILGLILSYLYEKYNSVLVPMMFHAAFNLSNYLPFFTENSTGFELIAVAIVSLAVFSVCAAVINSKTKNQTEK